MVIGAFSQLVLVPAWKVRPQRLKPHPWQFGYRSGEPLRYPKSWLREDFNQLRTPAGHKRRSRNLAVKFLRPATGERRMASRAIAFWSQLVLFDRISIPP